mgnify:FL=1
MASLEVLNDYNNDDSSKFDLITAASMGDQKRVELILKTTDT